ncbi:MAG: hypothetical protein GY870_18565 [archaeon]|nr:hypothetical protein [archaeon]
MTELITYIFEFIAMGVSFFVAFLLFKKSKDSQVSLGQKFLAIALFLVGNYALSTIIYSLIGQEWAILVFLRVGFISILISVVFLFYTMQILIHSSSWIKTNQKLVIITIIIAIIISLIMIIIPFIQVNDAATADTLFSPEYPFYAFALFVAFMLIYSAFVLYKFGISKNTGEKKKNMQNFFIGLLFVIGALIVDVIGNFFNELEILFDTLLFAVLSIGVIFTAIAFFGGKE